MTRLVVHAGTHATGWRSMQRQLDSWREPLTVRGVRLHPAHDADTWRTDVFAIAEGSPPPAVVDAAEAAVREGAELLLLSSERLEDSLRDAGRLAHLTLFAERHGMPLTLVVVVRDQLGYLNELYCERVSHLQMARDFPSFAADPSPADRFDYATAFALPLEATDLDLVAVPYAGLQPGVEAASILVAAGLDVVEVAELTGPPLPTVLPGPVPGALPGPVLLAAMRLLFKRLWRLGLVSGLPRPKVVQAAESLRRQAGERGWDTLPFWGWDPVTREAAIARYGPGNDLLARAVWGRPWGEDEAGSWQEGVFVDVDVASLAPALVVDVLGTVDALVRDLQAAKPAAPPE